MSDFGLGYIVDLRKIRVHGQDGPETVFVQDELPQLADYVRGLEKRIHEQRSRESQAMREQLEDLQRKHQESLEHAQTLANIAELDASRNEFRAAMPHIIKDVNELQANWSSEYIDAIHKLDQYVSKFPREIFSEYEFKDWISNFTDAVVAKHTEFVSNMPKKWDAQSAELLVSSLVVPGHTVLQHSDFFSNESTKAYATKFAENAEVLLKNTPEFSRARLLHRELMSLRDSEYRQQILQQSSVYRDLDAKLTIEAEKLEEITDLRKRFENAEAEFEQQKTIAGLFLVVTGIGAVVLAMELTPFFLAVIPLCLFGIILTIRRVGPVWTHGQKRMEQQEIVDDISGEIGVEVARIESEILHRRREVQVMLGQVLEQLGIDENSPAFLLIEG